ncbi:MULTISPECIES: carbon storage regulator CsrA [Clostridium]|uniref:Translational regulator CsrA n=1 Tax=Clostridium cibarium TaxID=2762247 RepID=A0ABR8PNV0_9CLOT|nr:carbon storage regulator CsrA [Clostridium sp. HBUAS56017]MBD7909859.1 carbon storage regulator CsrA [Clostridium cibarium]
MLVITRKEGESIVIGDGIEISVSKVSDGSVKLAINAPKEMTILRKELYDEIGKENIESAKIDLNFLRSLKK